MSIQFIKPSEFKEFVSSGTRFVFFGATWCKYCKRLSPRWLRLQESIKKSSKMQSYDLKLAKLDCTEEHEFCEMHGAPAYPTLMLYHNGRFEEEYTGDHQTKQMGDYLLQKLETLAPAHREL
ncbi:thioredoxin-like protein [Gorgonomyces haynaldii]|nr:thioredoxin-like protein [Gorgonomyces haynaldii]